MQDRMSEEHKVKWQMPYKVSKNGKYRYYDFDSASEEVKAKFIELYPASFISEMDEWFGLTHNTSVKIGRRLGLRRSTSEIQKRKNKGRKFPCHYIMRHIRETEPERYADILQRKSEAMKKRWQRAHREQLYGMTPTTRLKMVQMPIKQRKYKYNFIYRRKYFADPDHPYWICYDSQTRRSAEAEAKAAARGFKIVEGAD
jgi:hypothetical protein